MLKIPFNFKIFLTIIVLTIGFGSNVWALDRCREYVPEVRAKYFKYFGVNYPYWYGVGSMRQESLCRSDIVSFDGGMGLFQLTPSTGIVSEIERDTKVIVNPFNPSQNIEAHAYYVNKLYKIRMEQTAVKFKGVAISPKGYNEKCGKTLATMYQMYNGGLWFYYEAYKSGNDCNRDEVKKFCKRGGAWVGKNKDKWLSFCDVNYEYPIEVERWGNKYRLMKDSQEWKYWN